MLIKCDGMDSIKSMRILVIKYLMSSYLLPDDVIEMLILGERLIIEILEEYLQPIGLPIDPPIPKIPLKDKNKQRRQVNSHSGRHHRRLPNPKALQQLINHDIHPIEQLTDVMVAVNGLFVDDLREA